MERKPRVLEPAVVVGQILVLVEPVGLVARAFLLVALEAAAALAAVPGQIRPRAALAAQEVSEA